MGDYGLRVSKNNYDVLTWQTENILSYVDTALVDTARVSEVVNGTVAGVTTVAPQQRLVFDSDLDSFKLDLSANISLTIPNGATESPITWVTHNYGYQPIVVAYGELGTSGIFYQLPFSVAGTVQYHGEIIVTETQVGFKFRRVGTTTGALTRTFYYQIFKYPTLAGSDEMIGYAAAVGTSDISRTLNTYAAMADMSVTLTTGAGLTMIFFTAPLASNNSGGSFRILEDGVVIHGPNDYGIYDSAAPALHISEASVALARTTTAGSHTYSVEWRAEAGTIYQSGTTYAPRRLTVIAYG